jgi:four helix bundle protein
MKVKTFEDLQVWQDTRNFVKAIYELTSSSQFNKDFGLKDQIQRASVSIMNNISEGFERDSNREFIKFLGYSKGSAGEVRSMLYVALDLKYITKEEFELNYGNSLDIIKQLANFIKYLRTYSIKRNLNKVKNFIFFFFN